MHRNQLIALLEEYAPTASEEKLYKNNMLGFITTYENCFERTLEIGHITASAFIINKYNTHALLLHHAKLNGWFQLGGHCDGDSNVLAVAIKEAQEESGILEIVPVSHKIFDIDIHHIPENKREKAHDHYDVRFLLQVTTDAPLVQNRESKELRWVSNNIDELPTNSLSVTRMFHKWRCLRA